MVEAESQPVMTDCEKKVVKQIEYYFGDLNLSRDKFLQEQIKLDDGWVTMETMLKFNRLKQITEDVEVIASALRKSPTGLMEVSEDNLKIRRSVEKPLPTFSKELIDSMKQKSVYAKGFPKDLKLDQAMEFFEKYGPVDHILLRRNFSKEFKGSCFITFNEKESADKFMADETAKFADDIEFVKFYKEDYFKSKNKDKKVHAEKKEQTEKEALKEKIVAGAVLLIDGLPEGLQRDEIKEVFSKYGKVEWVDVLEKEKKAKLRFSQTDEAKTVLEEAKSKNEEGKIFLKDQEVTCSVLEGEEELSHWAEIFKSKAAKMSRPQRKGGNRRNDRNFGGKRKAGKSDGPQAKRNKPNQAENANDDDE